jgi:hypothetical protein
MSPNQISISTLVPNTENGQENFEQSIQRKPQTTSKMMVNAEKLTSATANERKQSCKSLGLSNRRNLALKPKIPIVKGPLSVNLTLCELIVVDHSVIKTEPP